MEKVKLTREQAEAIEYLKKLLSDTSERKRNLQLIKEKLDHDYNWESPNFKAANEIPDDIFIAALHYGYEVEPKFEVGDWVVWDDMKIIGQLVEIDSELRVDAIEYDFPQYISLKFLRHATPEEIQQEKERRWWARHGREVWELKVGDVLKDVTDGYTDVVESLYEMHVEFSDGVQYTKDGIKKYCRIVCFAEDRKDI